MVAIVRPSDRTVNIKKTANFEQATGSSSWKARHMLTLDADAGVNLVDEIEMGGTRHNAVDPQKQTLGLANPTWSGSAVLDLAQIGDFLLSLFGSVNTTDAGGGVYEHVFTSGGEGVGYFHVENRLAANFFTILDSAAVTQMTLNFADEDGSKKVQMSGFARNVRTPVTTQISSSPAAAPARAKVGGSIGLLKLGGVSLGNIVGGTCVIGNGAYTERYMNDNAGYDAIEVGMRSAVFSPEIRVRADAAAFLATLDGTTADDLELLYKLTDDLLLKIECPQVVANPVTPKPSGTNAMSAMPTFSASQTDAAPMCTVTLRNGIASY